MPLGGSNINWDEAKPADTDSAGLGDDEIRSLKTSLRNALDSEHNWPSTGGADTGYHRFGSARVFYAAQSLVSSSGTDGRLMVTSDTSRLFHVGSVATSFIGGPTVISAGSYPGGVVPQRAIWAMEFGQGQTKGSAVTTVTFPNSGFNGRPFVVATPQFIVGSEEGGLPVITSITATSFGLASVTTAGNVPSNTSFDWYSIGTRTL